MNEIIFSAIWGVIMMFCSFLVSNKSAYRHIAAIGLLVLLIVNMMETGGTVIFKVDTMGMLSYSTFGLLFNSIAIGCTLLYVLVSGKDIERLEKNIAEYLVLLFFVLCGVGILSAYNNLLMLFIGIEILTIPLYILTGSDKHNLKSNEAALKYFLMGSFSTGLMLMGIALMYGGTGTFTLEVARTETGLYKGVSFLEIVGLLLLMTSMCFKVSAAPFHFWTPDVYDGAPSVVTSFMATIVKVAGFIAFLKLCYIRMIGTSSAIDWRLLFSIIVVATLLFGNITAIFQQSVKRMMAYSSIAHAGFMLFALFSLNDFANKGLLLYSVAYCLATIGVFAVLAKVKDITYEGYNGLAKTQPVVAAANTVFLLSLAGIPLTAGFLAKYYMLSAVIATGTYTWLVVTGVVFAAISSYYYFRVIQAMYFKTGDPQTEDISGSFKVGLLALAAIIIIVGIFPQIIFNWLYF
ncbi:MAG: NADH-quinone oxidoreductase subunit N [Bacteroidetes bacterium]|nr:NADH-quinone oxidoreductase subunit N [Bacteroidota bacterium]